MTKDETYQEIILAKLSGLPVDIGDRRYLPSSSGWVVTANSRSKYGPYNGQIMLSSTISDNVLFDLIMRSFDD